MKLSEWMLKLNDQVSNGLGRVRGMANDTARSFTDLQHGLDQVGETGSQAISAIGDQIPALGGALNMLASPLGAVGAGIAVVTAALYKSHQAAAEFNSQFLELRQLNLNKTKEELDQLNDKVLQLAYANGFNATATAKAYFDIQSATGKYGAEVDAIVEKTGIFARVTKADMDASIQGVAKSINAFGLNARDMDAYFASSFKTVQVGITTFDQLAQVQTDYAGAAAAANQKVDDANKLFAAFTSSAKSVNEAATLTKTSFQDITKKATIDGFKKIGVNVFDAAGRMRSIDAITRDLVPRLGKLNDLDFAKLKEEIGGSEGLRGYLDKVKGMGPGLVKMFDSFDNTKFTLGAAIKNANGDWRIMADLIGNKVNVLAIRLGQTIMPAVMNGVATVVEYLDKAVNMHDSLNKRSELYRDLLWSIGAPIKMAWTLFKEMLRPIGSVLEGVGKIYDRVRGLGGSSVGKSLFGDASRWYEVFRNVIDNAIGTIGHLWDAINKGLSLDFTGAKKSLDAAKGTLMNDVGRSRVTKTMDEAATSGTDGAVNNASTADAAAADSGSMASGINDVSGGGKSVRNVTVNITKLIESINLTMPSGGQRISDTDLVRQIEEAVVRAITGAEMTLTNG